MAAKDSSFSVRLNDETKGIIENTINHLSINKTELFKIMIDYLPLLVLLKEENIDMNTAIDRIHNKMVETEIKIIKKGVNHYEFDNWKAKLFTYNKNANHNERVFITQNLFLDLIGGNVNTISQIFRDNETEIQAHNNEMGVEKSNNRKLSAIVRKSGFESLADWIKSKTA